MKAMKKRIISFIMAFVMVLVACSFGSHVHAEESLIDIQKEKESLREEFNDKKKEEKNEIENEIEELKEEKKRISSKKKKNRSEIKKIETKLKEKKQALEDENKKLEGLKEVTKEEIKKAEEKKKIAKAEKTEAENNLKNKKKEKEHIKNKITSAEKYLEQAEENRMNKEAEGENIYNEQAEAQEQYDDAKKAVDDFIENEKSSEIDKAKFEVEDQKEKVDSTKQTVKNIKDKIKGKDGEIEEQKEEIKTIDEELNPLIEERDRLDADYDKKRDAYRKADQEYTEKKEEVGEPVTDEEIQEMQKKADEAKSKKYTVFDFLKWLETKTGIKAELAGIREAEDILEQYNMPEDENPKNALYIDNVIEAVKQIRVGNGLITNDPYHKGLDPWKTNHRMIAGAIVEAHNVDMSAGRYHPKVYKGWSAENMAGGSPEGSYEAWYGEIKTYEKIFDKISKKTEFKQFQDDPVVLRNAVDNALRWNEDYQKEYMAVGHYLNMINGSDLVGIAYDPEANATISIMSGGDEVSYTVDEYLNMLNDFKDFMSAPEKLEILKEKKENYNAHKDELDKLKDARDNAETIFDKAIAARNAFAFDATKEPHIIELFHNKESIGEKIKTLEDEKANLEQALKKNQTTLEKQTKELETKQAALDQLISEKSADLVEARNEAEKILNDANSKVDIYKAEMNDINERITNLEENIFDNKKKLPQLETEIQNLTKILTVKTKVFKTAESYYETIKEEFDAYNEEENTINQIAKKIRELETKQKQLEKQKEHLKKHFREIDSEIKTKKAYLKKVKSLTFEDLYHKKIELPEGSILAAYMDKYKTLESKEKNLKEKESDENIATSTNSTNIDPTCQKIVTKEKCNEPKADNPETGVAGITPLFVFLGAAFTALKKMNKKK